MGVVRHLVLLMLAALAVAPARADPVLPVRVVVVTAFEIGDDVGDRAGEYQAWAAVMPRVIDFPAGFRHLRYDPDRRVLLVSTGVGTNRAAASIMALGLDPRFDLSRAYWLVAAIAGVDPATGSVGSAAWIGDVVDTDYGYAIDPREAPAGWTTGMFARDRRAPYAPPRPAETGYNLFPLDKSLRDWAYRLTHDVRLADTAALQEIRAPYRQWPAATLPPRVMTGAEASGQTFWHGALLNTHVERWVAYWTGGGEPFVVTAMEDTGVAGALAMLGRAGRVDPRRLMVLRTASNYSTPPPGIGAAASLTAEAKGLSALQPALDAAFAVGGRVVDQIARHWDRYRDTVPGAPPDTAAGAPSTITEQRQGGKQ